MDAIANALEDVNLAFRQLEFAIRVMCYCELDHLDREKFDTDLMILLEPENVDFEGGQFHSLESVIKASQMQVQSSFGVSAIVLDAAFEAAGCANKPKAHSPRDDLRCLVYMVRCAFAHNMAAPSWEARGADFARAFTLPLDEPTVIDLSGIHGQIFSYEHIGGFAQWFKIKDAAVRFINGA